MPSKDIPFEVLNDPPPFYPDVGHRATQIKGQTQQHRRQSRQQQKLILKEYHTMVHSGAYLSHYLLRPPPLESLLLLLSSSSSAAAATTSTTNTTTTADRRLLFSSRRRRRCQHRHTRSIRRPVEGKGTGRKCSKVPQPQLLSSSQERRCWPRLEGC